jgi:hypothetical protein
MISYSGRGAYGAFVQTFFESHFFGSFLLTQAMLNCLQRDTAVFFVELMVEEAVNADKIQQSTIVKL